MLKSRTWANPRPEHAAPRHVRAIFVLLTVAVGSVSAQELTVVAEDFEQDPPGYQVVLEETGDAMASIEFSDLGNTREMIYQGNWLTDPKSSELELAFGVLAPQLQTMADFQFDPGVYGAIEGISTSADAILNGRPGDTNFLNEAVGFVLRLYQNQDGELNVYESGRRLDSRDRIRFQMLQMTPEDFFQILGTGSAQPDFSASAQPMAFGLSIGNGWRLPGQPATAIQTSARIDNWQVSVILEGTLLVDGFE